MKEVSNFVVLGAGSMGAQIGALAAEAGFNVKIRDIVEGALARARQTVVENCDRRIQRGRLTEEGKQLLLGRMSFVTDLKGAVEDADYVIEAVPEILSLKQQVFAEAAALSPADTVFATNTSSLSISEIAKGARHPDRIVGTHYFNPPGALLLLEIIQGESTSSETLAIAGAVGKRMGREVVHVKDIPGFLVNRIWMMMAQEADWAVAQGEARDPFEVDSAARYKLGLPMGLLEIDDVIQGGSMDTRFHVSETFRETLGASYGPGPLLTAAFKAGYLGKKSGRGFYDWSPGKTNEIPMNAGANFDPIRVLANGVNECAKLLETGATTREEIDRAVLYALNYPRGVLRMADSTGLDRIVAELDRLYAKYSEQRYKTSELLRKMVAEGRVGRKAGVGFYPYGFGEYEFVRLDVRPETGVARLILNRTYRANALNYDFLVEIDQALNEIENRGDIGCVVITGAGSNFSGGADLATFASQDPAAVMRFSEFGQDLSTRIETYPKPVIAAVNGPAMGGGFEMVLACDLRVMSRKAQFRLPELTLGISPGFGGIQRLARQVGVTRAKEAVLLSEPISPDKALDWGIVNQVVDADKLEAAVDEMARKLAAGAPLTQRFTKEAFYYGLQADQRTGLFTEAAISAAVLRTNDVNEGLTAVSYRRPPRFTGK
jgi:enoyl-CoA hydratase/3-hydroxyacyl-CoA dehydrogenase